MKLRLILLVLCLGYSTTSIAEDRSSIGLQVGRFLNQGLSYQYVLDGHSSINANANLFLGTLGLGVDWVYMFADTPASNYSALRGQWMPYMGLGIQSGWFSGFRGLAGIQYGFEEHPLNFFFSFILFPNDFDTSYLGGLLGLRFQL